MEIETRISIFDPHFYRTIRQIGNKMKKGIHPEYRPVVFQDASANFAILTRSTIKTNEKITWEDGNTYPLVKLEISSASHPFFTGKQKLLDTAGRVEKFKKKYGKKES